jgi:hypothetical protein
VFEPVNVITLPAVACAVASTSVVITTSFAVNEDKSTVEISAVIFKSEALPSVIIYDLPLKIEASTVVLSSTFKISIFDKVKVTSV